MPAAGAESGWVGGRAGLGAELERDSLSRWALALRRGGERFALPALLLLALALLAAGRLAPAAWEPLAAALDDAVLPVLQTAAAPLRSLRQLGEGVRALATLHATNRELRAQNAQLLAWQRQGRQLALENASLRKLLRMPAARPAPLALTARVVADTDGPFMHTVLIDAGRDRGVAAGMAAVHGTGLVGKVIQVGRRSARVMLLTDLNSRIPVSLAGTREPAILAGDNSALPQLMFLPLSPRLAPGDAVVTSGRGGVLPPGLLAGVVDEVAPGRVSVRPVVDGWRLDHVQLLAFPAVPPPEPASAALDELPAALAGRDQPGAGSSAIKASLRREPAPAGSLANPPQPVP